jgi:Tfp pilus assembly protein PilO
MSQVITPILLLIASLGLFFTYLKPAYGILEEFQAQEKEIDKAIVDAERLVKRYDDLLLQRNSLSSANMKDLKKILPDNIDVVGMIIDISHLAGTHNLNINSFDVPVLPVAGEAPKRNKNKEEASPIASAILGVEITGDYFDFKELISGLERSMSLMDVVGIEIEVEEDKEDENEDGKDYIITYTVELQGYWLIEEL